MLVRTRTRHIKRPAKRSAKLKLRTKREAKATAKSIPWRKALKGHLSAYSEAGVMLRGSRLKKGLTQQELADALDINQHHISEMENGKRPLGKAMAKKFAEFFKVDYHIFL